MHDVFLTERGSAILSCFQKSRIEKILRDRANDESYFGRETLLCELLNGRYDSIEDEYNDNSMTYWYSINFQTSRQELRYEDDESFK